MRASKLTTTAMGMAGGSYGRRPMAKGFDLDGYRRFVIDSSRKSTQPRRQFSQRNAAIRPRDLSVHRTRFPVVSRARASCQSVGQRVL
jgi:hypothetical protein